MTDKSVTSHEKLNTNQPALSAAKAWNPKTKKSFSDCALYFSFSWYDFGRRLVPPINKKFQPSPRRTSDTQ